MSFRALMTTTIGVIAILFYSPELFYQVDSLSVLRVTAASLLGAFGLVCMIFALQKGTLRQLGMFNLLTIAFTITYLFLFENFNVLDFLSGTSLIVLGFGLYVFQIKRQTTEEFNLKLLIYYTLMSFFFAASGIVHWYNLKQAIPPLFSVVNQEVIVFLVALTGFLSQPKLEKTDFFQRIKESSLLVVSMAILIFVAVLTGFLGLKITNPFLASLLPLATPVLTILFGALFFKEKWNRGFAFSLLMILIGAYMLHLNWNHN